VKSVTLVRNSFLLILLLGGVFSGSAWGQRQKSIIPDVEAEGVRGEMARKALAQASARFLATDENGDGAISREEAARHSPYINENFSRYDKSGDGTLSWEEFIGHDRWPRPEKPSN
jgi:hypothetical protein